ncbi:hypothetical protein [Primorskyibacter sp. S187A]|uniref:hypothetical protein n=1 Tax=Primorskyibacter sp. S187A TaxID=3415130 RepID=UPI003C7D637A
MLETLLSLRDEVLLLLAGSGGTIAWSWLQNSRDTPTKIDTSIEKISFGLDPLNTAEWEGLLSHDEFQRIERSFLARDTIVFDSRIQKEINEISVESGTIRPCFAMAYNGETLFELFQGAIVNYGRMGVYEKTAELLAEGLEQIPTDDEAAYLHYFNSAIQGTGLSTPMFTSILVAHNRGEMQLEDLIDEKEENLAKLVLSMIQADTPIDQKAAARKQVEQLSVPAYWIADNGVTALLCDFPGFGIGLTCEGHFAPQRKKSAAVIYSLVASCNSSKMAEVFRRQRDRAARERESIEKAISSFNDLLLRSSPSTIRVVLKVFNSARYAAALSNKCRFVVQDERFPSFDLIASDTENQRLGPRDVVLRTYAGEVDHDFRDALHAVIKAGNAMATAKIDILTRKGKKEEISPYVAFR